MTRSVFLKLRLSPADKGAIERKAARASLSPSDFVRREVGLRVNRPPSAALEQENPGSTALQRLGLTSAESDAGET